MSQWYKRRKYYKSQNYKVLVCDNEEYEAGHNKDLSKWKVSWEPKKAAGVSKKIQSAAVVAKKTKVAEKSIAERLNINIKLTAKSRNKNKNKNSDEDESDNNIEDEVDDEDEDEVMHERQRNDSRGKGGLAGKGCLIDMSMFGQ
jgi:hypothetical protein